MSHSPADESQPTNDPSTASSRAALPSRSPAAESRDEADDLAALLDEMSAAAALGDFATASEITLAALDRFGGDDAPMTTAWLCQHLAGILRDGVSRRLRPGTSNWR